MSEELLDPASTEEAVTAAWNPSPRTLAFLAAIRITPQVGKAAAAAGIRRESHSRRMKSCPHYRAAFEEAHQDGIQACKDEAVRRAHQGVQRLVLYHGAPVYVPQDPNDPNSKLVALVEHEYSDTLLMRILEAYMPDQFSNRVKQETRLVDEQGKDRELRIVFVTKTED